MSIWTAVYQKLDFFVRKSWLSVIVNVPAKKKKKKDIRLILVLIHQTR